MKNRSRLEITSAILRATSSSGGETRTRIMYSAYLSYPQVRDYLRLLTESGLIVYEEGTQVYRATEKGLRFLRLAETAEALVGIGPEAQEGRAPFSLR